jgi:hypothetical protein
MALYNFVFVSGVIAAACGGATSQTTHGSRGMRADEHLAAADQHTEQAEQLSRWPERRPEQLDGYFGIGIWYRTWDIVSPPSHLARVHRSAAAQIDAEYEEACGQRSHAEVSVSPLQQYGLGGAPTDDGVVVFLAPEAGPPDALIAAMRCHRAWMMLGRTDMDTCPLDLAGVRVAAHDDASGITVEITVDDKSLIPELQRRVAQDLEAAARRHER